MSTTTVATPTSHLRFGHARLDITPPVGIYHPMWGAARHHRAAGIHRPLFADALALAPLGGGAPIVRIQMDHVGMEDEQQEELVRRVSAVAGIPPEHVQSTFSHTHSSGMVIGCSDDKMGSIRSSGHRVIWSDRSLA